jgi:hypothetical protein
VISVVSAVSDEIAQKFIEHVAKWNRQYETIDEYMMRRYLFAKMDAEIADLNAKHNPETFFAHNFFSDLTDEEKKYLTDKNMVAMLKAANRDYSGVLPFEDASNQALPMSYCHCCVYSCTSVGTAGGHGFKSGLGADQG